MHFATTIEITAPREQVWATLADVERWPEWTKSVTSVELLTGAPLSGSSRVRIKQPRLKALEWDVTEFVPNEVFTWTSSTLGITSVGSHRITAATGDRVTVTLALAPIRVPRAACRDAHGSPHAALHRHGGQGSQIPE